ncbi:DUF4403 family protein [Sphingomonas sp. H39-1-10]|uniref:DUF4403 family protein n=1 Tax=Sphingomonas pollutisoli TaxID=3030829 RepID=UPI0023B9FE02|nr:DUF4403 family protein [Sphingomonas pollutisoli]MDF0488456.1 DUF4403 family protein [Sphingomonas pollutisoli]
MESRSIVVLATASLLVSACGHKVQVPPPHRVESAPDFPIETSSIVVPISGSLDDVQRALEAKTPRRLWRIDKRLDKCVGAQRVDLRIARVKLLPDLGCRVVGAVTRGRLVLGGSGDRLTITFPVHAAIAAEKVGGIVSKTATGDAVVRAVARLSITGDWKPTATVRIAYDWTTAPGIDFLGQRIEFATKADARLTPVIASLEQSLPRELNKLDLHRKLASAWPKGFTSIMLNRDKPPAWMRVTPKRLGFGGYHVSGRRLTLLLSADALTETFVGDRPSDPVATPLPPPVPTTDKRGINFFVPVLADYAQLEPVVKRALVRRAKRGISLPGIGPVEVEFGDVTVYATTGGHLAVGVKAKAHARTAPLLSTKGQVWLTAVPYNVKGSQLVRVRDVGIATDTDSGVTNLLIALFKDGSIRDSIARGLSHDFAPDYAKVLRAARKAIGARREGDFVLSADVTKVENGTLAVTGKGLFMPVRATGQATITYAP